MPARVQDFPVLVNWAEACSYSSHQESSESVRPEESRSLI
jgi:hypothetical protein